MRSGGQTTGDEPGHLQELGRIGDSRDLSNRNGPIVLEEPDAVIVHVGVLAQVGHILRQPRRAPGLGEEDRAVAHLEQHRPGSAPEETRHRIGLAVHALARSGFDRCAQPVLGLLDRDQGTAIELAAFGPERLSTPSTSAHEEECDKSQGPPSSHELDNTHKKEFLLAELSDDMKAVVGVRECVTGFLGSIIQATPPDNLQQAGGTVAADAGLMPGGIEQRP